MNILLLLLLFQGSVKLAWDPVADSRLLGYKVHYGTSSGSYSTYIDVGNVTEYTVTDLPNMTRVYFVVSAYGIDGGNPISSSYSNEVSAMVGRPFPPELRITGVVENFAVVRIDFRNSLAGPQIIYERKSQ